MFEVSMRTRLIRRRLARLEKQTGPQYDKYGNRLISYIDDSRRMWKLDKERFMKIGRAHEIVTFQAEDAAEAEEERRRLRGRRRRPVSLKRQ